jgi:hypothetical protein
MSLQVVETWTDTISLALVPEVWFSPSPFLTSVPVLFSISLVKGPLVLIIWGYVLCFLVVFLLLCVQWHWDHGPSPIFDGTPSTSCSVLKGSAVLAPMAGKEDILMEQKKIQRTLKCK